MNKIAVYFMPGLAASSSIFERIVLPEKQFEIVLLEWELPFYNETLHEYAKRISQKVTHENPVLIGVSFGGIVVQEMAQFLKVKKVIIISSVKTNLEFSHIMKIAKNTNAYRLIPTNLLSKIGSLQNFRLGKKINQRVGLYSKFFTFRDKYYLFWAMKQLFLWERKVADKNVIHIHGDLDEVFPIKKIQNCITVKGGTHIMILTKYKWFNANLPGIILGED